ncbi:MAG: hypothetical protein KAS12_06450 [Candidatus Aenigmarchaeota archaeon]|nr:hypothetical protein [Candidatus Aenigmarchaeota archaeon]
MEYFTRNGRGDKIFSVIVDDSNFIVVKSVDDLDKPPVLEFEAKKIFVGKSKESNMTYLMGRFGPNFDGNSMLFAVENNKYIFVGEKIVKFTTNSKIIEFVSNMENTNHINLYAIDRNDAYYICDINVKISNIPEEYRFAPCRYYGDVYFYQNHEARRNQMNVKKFYIGTRKVIFPYTLYPNDEYERLTKKVPLYVVYVGQREKVLMTKEMFIFECNAINAIYGCELINKNLPQYT